MKALRIAVVGAGAIGRAHATVLLGSRRLALSAIVDPGDAAEAYAQETGVAFFRTLDALWAAQKPDGVILATPNTLHVQQALQCLDAGVAVLVEKPIAHSVEDARRLVQRVEGGQGRVLVGHHRAHSPLMARACEVVRSGQLGALVCIAGSATFYKPDAYFDETWRREPGGGPVLINMVHEVHNLRMLCGDIAEVQAMASHARRGFAVEDTACVNLRFANGALGSFVVSDVAASARSWEQTSQENPAYASYADEDCYVLSGTMGSLSVPTLRTKCYATDAQRSWFQPMDASQIAVPRENPLALQMEHFADVIEGKAPPLVSALDGLRNLQVVEAIASAAASGQVVRLM